MSSGRRERGERRLAAILKPAAARESGGVFGPYQRQSVEPAGTRSPTGAKLPELSAPGLRPSVLSTATLSYNGISSDGVSSNGNNWGWGAVSAVKTPLVL
jgi:hypothetical protein